MSYLMMTRRLAVPGVIALLAGCGADRPVAPVSSAARTAAPTAPSGLAADAISEVRIELSWWDNATNESGFEVQRSTTGAAGIFSVLARTAANVTSQSDTSLRPATEYCYRVRAFVTRLGTTSYSGFTDTVCRTTKASVPEPPIVLSAVAVSATGIELAWMTELADETGYTVERCEAASCDAFAEVARLDADAARWTDSGLSPSTAYAYRVRARRAVGYSAYSNIATATTRAMPPSLHVTSRTTGVDLDADGYEVTLLRAGCPPACAGTDGVRTASLSANGTVTLSDLNPGTRYGVTLRGDAPNCYLTSPATLLVTMGSTNQTVGFELSCGRALPIAYSSDAAGDTDIYVVSSTGAGGGTRLTSGQGSNAEPAWSPDGGRIAFRGARDGSADIYLMNADGSNTVRLTHDAAEDAGPTWSPDGRSIAFTADGEIRIVSADGAQPPVSTGQPGADPAWSPDGARIAFALGGAIMVMNPDGSGVTQLTHPELPGYDRAGEYHSQPAWSPDGRRIAFARSECDGMGFGCMHQLMVVNADGSGLRAVMPWQYGNMGSDPGEPAWSPDGRKLAFSDGVSVMVIREDASDWMTLAPGAGPAWRR